MVAVVAVLVLVIIVVVCRARSRGPRAGGDASNAELLARQRSPSVFDDEFEVFFPLFFQLPPLYDLPFFSLVRCST